MLMFVFAIVLAILAIVAAMIYRRIRPPRIAAGPSGSGSTGTEALLATPASASHDYGFTKGHLIALWSAIVLGALAILLTVTSSIYTQDVGEANVIRDWTGNVAGQETASGLHLKAPWQDIVTFNIRNQQVVFSGTHENNPDYTGGEAIGPQITVQDEDGVTDNIDIALRYSIDSSYVDQVYRQFKTEDNFKVSFIEQDLRGAVRQVPNDFSTLDLITKRAKVEAGVLAELQKRWRTTGVSIDSVSLQEIRPPKSVVASYAAAQQAQIDVTKAQANLSATKVDAQQKVVQAQAEADANAILNASLTPAILQQHYLDALKAGTVYVVPEGSTPYIGAAR